MNSSNSNERLAPAPAGDNSDHKQDADGGLPVAGCSLPDIFTCMAGIVEAQAESDRLVALHKAGEEINASHLKLFKIKIASTVGANKLIVLIPSEALIVFMATAKAFCGDHGGFQRATVTADESNRVFKQGEEVGLCHGNFSSEHQALAPAGDNSDHKQDADGGLPVAGCCASDNVVIQDIVKIGSITSIAYTTTDGKPPHPDSRAVREGILSPHREGTYLEVRVNPDCPPETLELLKRAHLLDFRSREDSLTPEPRPKNTGCENLP